MRVPGNNSGCLSLVCTSDRGSNIHASVLLRAGGKEITCKALLRIISLFPNKFQ